MLSVSFDEPLGNSLDMVSGESCLKVIFCFQKLLG
jgi:hypothetical protein